MTDGRAVILAVDDDEGDLLLLKEALRDFKAPHRVDSACDGEEAMAYLRREAAPDLILLDLNLPRKDGREVFAEVKADARLSRIPLVVLTTSTSDQDIVAGHDPKRNLYLSKPMRLAGYVSTIRAIERFWRAAARVPA